MSDLSAPLPGDTPQHVYAALQFWPYYSVRHVASLPPADRVWYWVSLERFQVAQAQRRRWTYAFSASVFLILCNTREIPRHSRDGEVEILLASTTM